RDIITGASRKAEIGAPQGLPVSRMDRRQRGLLLALLDEYARAMPEAVAQERLRRLREAGIEKVHFAWAGGPERGQPHYYRLRGGPFCGRPEEEEAAVRSNRSPRDDMPGRLLVRGRSRTRGGPQNEGKQGVGERVGRRGAAGDGSDVGLSRAAAGPETGARR